MSLENTALSLEDEEFVDELKPATKLMHGQYTIESFLAAGGFGITYLARDSLNRRVVIKECFPGSLCRRQNHSVTPRSRAHQAEVKSIVRLFSQEAMNLAKANHPNIVGVHQVFEENNTAYMALDYVQGRDLLEILEDDPESLKPELVEGYLLKILDAIGHIHNMGMLHRDISPDNIIISETGEPILIDFGAARESKNEKVTRMLSALRVVKDGYSPQEFYIAGSDQPPSCDLYSLAASFYHIIAGELPPDSQWRLSARAAGDPDPYVSIGEKTDAYSKSFVTALDKAMSILPRERMQSAEEWIAHMTNTAPVVSKVAPTRVASVSGGREKNAMMPLLLGGTALAALVGVGVYVMSSSDSDPATVSVTATETAVGDETAAVQPVSESDTFPAEVATPIEEDVAIARTLETPEPVVSEPAVPVEEEATAPSIPVEVSPAAAPESVETPASVDIAGTAADQIDTGLIIAPSTPVTETAGIIALAAAPENNDVVPSAPVDTPILPVADAVVVTPEPVIPAAEETTDFSVPPILLALPEHVVVPQPRPLRDLEVAMSALQDTQPVIRSVAPAAPTETATATSREEPQAQNGTVEATAPIDTSETGAPTESAEPLAPGVEFFVSMAKSQPELAAASKPSSAAATSEPATSSQNASATVTSPIITRFVPTVPFALSEARPGLIAAVSVDAPSWLTDQSQIVSVNGQAVESNEQINTLITQAASQDVASSFEITLGLASGVNGAVFERELSVSKEKHTLLLNGLRFVTSENNSVWTTKVLEAPEASNFKVGDTIVSYVSTWESLDGPNSLEIILERELAKGTSGFSFAVSRDDEIWVETFNLAALAN